MSDSAIFYLDESGDLGWSFNAPYRQGGSSRYLTIAALRVHSGKQYLPKRAVRRLYADHGWNTSEEKKWSHMDADERLAFAERAKDLVLNHSEHIKLHVIAVNKQNVAQHIRADENKLYNYMIRLLLPDELAKYDKVHLNPDARAIKVASGNSLHDYLQTELWFTSNVKTELNTTPRDSASTANLQFTDMLAGVASSHYEDGRSEPWNILRPHIGVEKQLFFNP